MLYSEDIYLKQYKETAQMVKFLQECKLAGSYETKLDLGNVIRLLSNQDNLIKHLKQELKSKISEFENLKKTTEPSK